MKLTTITSLLALILATFAAPAPADEAMSSTSNAAAPTSPKIPGYNQKQSDNAWAIVKQIEAEKFGKIALTACKIAFATAIVESNLVNWASEAVPKSLKYPHDKVKSKKDADHDSVGVFQQRERYYPVAQAMSPANAAHLFFEKMRGVKNWKKADSAKEIGNVAQKTQVSGFPERYAKHVDEAAKICKAGKIKGF